METVLIVEDEVTTRNALIELLGKDGREIVTAGDGQEAMECLVEGARPRVILLDLMMPRMAAHDAAVQMIETPPLSACISMGPASQGTSTNRWEGHAAALTSKIHALVDSNGLPVRLALSPGEAHDVRLAGNLLSRLKSGSMLLADCGYDADWIRELARKKGAWANIPPKSNRSDPDLLQPLSLPCSQPGRAVLQQDQNNVAGLQRAMTGLPPTTLRSFSLRQSGYGLRLNESASLGTLISGPEVSPDIHLRSSEDVPSQIADSRPVGSNRSFPCPAPAMGIDQAG